MADELFDGVLGGEQEKSEAAAETPAGVEAFAAAIAAIASRQDPQVARDTSIFLKKQAHLLDLQAQHLKDEHASRLTHLRLTVGAARRKRYADYMRNALYTCIALLVVGVLLAAVRMTVQAVNDHGLVVEDFTVPSDLAARGVTSQALAEDLASRVAAIRATANHYSLTYSSDVRTDQADTLKVQIPETGISVDELERFLHRWLGRQTVVSGELVEGAGGSISVVLHIAGADPIAVSGSSADLNGLLQSAAEQAFAVFGPTNDIIYLQATGRPAEAYAAAQRYAHSASLATPSVRASAYALLGAVDPDERRGLASGLIAIDIDPRVLVGWREAARVSADLGHDEAALDFARKMLATKRDDQPTDQRDAYPWLIAQGQIEIDRATGDLASLLRDYEIYDRRPTETLAERYVQRARVAALLHDEPYARHELSLALAAGPLDIQSFLTQLGADSTALETRWVVSSSAGDWAQALEVAKGLVAAEEEAQNSPAPQSNLPRSEFAAKDELVLATQYRPFLAYAAAMTGDTASATALISQTPTDCYLCVRTRAKVAALAGDAASADRWFAEAVRQAPDLPMAYFEWGQALLARGDLAGAARELSLAHDKGPHWADPLKAWGDVLVKQGHPDQALTQYDEALKYAPNWPALRQARTAAASRRG